MPVRKSPASVVINPNVRALRIYPVENTEKTVSQLKTVGVKLSSEQAIHLARVLLAVSQDWDEVDITGYRFTKRSSDNTHQVTVTGIKQK